MSDIRLRATIVVEYDANPRFYDSVDPEYMAEIDQRNWEREGPSLIDEMWDEVSVKVEPV